MHTSRSHRTTALLTFVFVIALVSQPKAGADGQLDPEFASGAGFISFQLSTGDRPNDQALGVLVDGNDRILATGFRSTGLEKGVQRDMVVMRLLESGTPDPAFGTNGISIIDFDLGGAVDGGFGVFESGDGGYLVCGLAQDASAGPFGYSRFAIARLLADGSLDTGFNGDGKFDFALLPDGLAQNRPAGCAQAPDGSLVVVGMALVDGEIFGEIVMARVLADASLDPDFGDAGVAVVALPESKLTNARANAVQIDAQGRIVIAGQAENLLAPDAPNTDMLAARLLADGSLDPDFGNGGIRTVAFDAGSGNFDVAVGLTLYGDGAVLLVGLAATAADGVDIAVVRLTDSGEPDPGFGNNGGVLHGLDPGTGANETGLGVTLDPRGRIYVAGRATAGPQDEDAALLRLLGNGAIDTSFGDGGWRLFGLEPAPEPSLDAAFSITLDGQNRAVAAGSLLINPADEDFDFLVARLTTGLLFYDGFESVE